MKILFLILTLVISHLLKSQTKLYYTNSDGTIDKNSYYYVNHSSGGVICHDKTLSYTNDTGFYDIKIDSNKVNWEYKDRKTNKAEANPMWGGLGYLTADKKIIEYAAKANHHETRPSYIKENKIYSFDNKIIAIIEGEEIYGAALYLMRN